MRSKSFTTGRPCQDSLATWADPLCSESAAGWEDPWKMAQQHSRIALGESHGQGLVDYNPGGREESVMTEHLSLLLHLHLQRSGLGDPVECGSSGWPAVTRPGLLHAHGRQRHWGFPRTFHSQRAGEPHLMASE